MSKKLTYTVSSGNVFADLGDPAPEESLFKAKLVHGISTAIRARGLTQEQAGEILGIDQPKVSALVNGRFSGFSVDRLLKYVTTLGNDVDIVVHPKAAAEEHAVVRVHDSVAALAALQRGQKRLGSLRAGAAIEKAHTERKRHLVKKAASRQAPLDHD